MTIFIVKDNNLMPVAEKSFAAVKVLEKDHLQKWLKAKIDVLAPGLMVIAEEYGSWVDSKRRIDLLCLDRDGYLVVIELKRTDDGGHMELQALRYAAMVSQMTFAQLVDAYAQDLKKANLPYDQAGQTILDFLGLPDPDEEAFPAGIKIILASADFSTEVTTTVLWLNQQGLDIRCIRIKPYDLDGTLLLDVQPIIPLPETSAFQTQIKAKQDAEKKGMASRHEERIEFWGGLLEVAKAHLMAPLGLNPSKNNWLTISGGKGLDWKYVVREKDSQVELYIDFGPASDAKNLAILKELREAVSKVAPEYAKTLDWQELPEAQACRVRHVLAGGYRSARNDWGRVQSAMVSAMQDLQETIKPYLQTIDAK